MADGRRHIYNYDDAGGDAENYAEHRSTSRRERKRYDISKKSRTDPARPPGTRPDCRLASRMCGKVIKTEDP